VRVLVTCERRFKRSPDGVIWTTSTDDYEFWKRYLEIFREVSVLSRVEEVAESRPSWKLVEGDGVRVTVLPNYIGLGQYLLRLREIRRVVQPAVEDADAAVLRIPSHVASSVIPFVRRQRLPYAVEVVGDPYEAFAPGAIDHPLRPLLRWRTCREVRYLCAHADAAAYVTQSALQRRYPPGPRTHATYYSSLDLSEADLAPGAKAPPRPGEPFVLASVGSMELAYKGLSDLVVAASRCAEAGLNVRVLLIGGGRSEGTVRAVARSMGMEGRVTFLGELPGSRAVLNALREAHLFVLPSKTEGLPRVMIEAMSQGLPCLGTRVGGTPELLPPERIFEPGDVSGLVDRIRSLASNPEEMAADGTRNLKKAREFLDTELQPKRASLYRHLKGRAIGTPQKSVRWFVLAPGLLGLRTNLRRFTWSYGQDPPASSYPEYEACRLRLELRREANSAFARSLWIRKAVPHGKYHYCTGLKGQDDVLYDRPFFFGRRMFLQAESLLGETPRIRANRNYFRFVHYRFMNLHSVNYVLTDIATLLLLRKGLLALHCSSFRLEGRTVVVLAPSNSGKTLTTMLMCMDHGAEFLAEDLAVTDGKMVYGIPWTNTFRYYARVDQRWLSRLVSRGQRMLPFLDLMPGLVPRRAITDFVPEERVCPSAEATDLVILERGKESVAALGPEETARRAENLNRSEFNYLRSLVINAHEYFNPELDVPGMQQRERAIFSHLAASVGTRHLIRAEDPLQYPSLLFKALGMGSRARDMEG